MKNSTFSKRIGAFLLAGLLLFVFNAPIINADETKKPELRLVSNDMTSFDAGEKCKLQVELTNISNYSAYNLMAELVPASEDAKIFKEKPSTVDIYEVGANRTKSFEIPFELRIQAPEKDYTMNLKLNYSNDDGDSFQSEIPVYIYVRNSKSEAVLVVADSSVDTEKVSSAKPSKLKIKIANKGDFTAKNVKVEGMNFDPKGVFLVDDSNIKKLSSIGVNKSKTAEFNVQSTEDLESDYELMLKITYNDSLGQTLTKEAKVLVPCSDIKKKTKITDIDMEFSQEEYYMDSDKKREIKLTLTNKGDTKIEDLKLQLSAESGIIFLSKYLDLIDEIKAGESKEFTYKIVLSDSKSKGSYPITARLMPVKEEGSESKIQICSAISENDGSEEKGGKKPKIIIADYSYGKDKIIAGKEFELSIFLKNTSLSTGVRNCKVTYSSESEIFIPIDAANSFFIESISPGETIEKKIKLTSPSDAQAKMYKMSFSAEYEDFEGNSYDEKGNPYKSDESIVLNLSQQIRLEVPEFKVQPFAMMGEGIPLDVEFYNMGKAPLYNMMVKFEGNFDCDMPNYFVGNFEASRSDMYSAKITPIEEGSQKGKLIFEFEDERGTKQSIEKEFTIDVEAMPEGGGGKMEDGFVEPDFDKEGMIPDEDIDMEFDENGNPIPASKGLSTTWMIVIGVVALIVIIIVLKVVLKKKKKKKLEKLLLETDDESK